MNPHMTDVTRRRPWMGAGVRRMMIATGLTVGALAAGLVLPSTRAFAQDEAAEREVRDYIGDRDSYRNSLKADLGRRQVVLRNDEAKLAQQQQALDMMQAQMRTGAVSADGDAPSPAAMAKQVEAQKYRVLLARNAVQRSREDVDRVNSILTRMQTPGGVTGAAR